MAENINLTEILNEMFKGRDAALEKYAKVRHTQYELQLWRVYGLPLTEVDKSAKAYFSKRFLKGERIDKVDDDTLNKALDALDHAVKDGCRNRCAKLVQELNIALIKLNLRPVKNVGVFLDWLTFSSRLRVGEDGSAIIEKPYGFPIYIFNDERNRRELWAELQSMIKMNKMSSMQYAASIVVSKRHHTVSF